MNEPMRVAVVSETYPPEVNGVALTVQSLCSGLRTRGHAVQLFRPCQAGETVTVCRTLAGRAANPSARPIFPPVLDRERQLSACEPAKIWPRAAEFSPRPPKPDRLLGGGADDWRLPAWPLPRYPGLRVGRPAGRALRHEWSRRRPDAVYIATEGPLGWSALNAARALDIPVCTGFHTRFDHYMSSYGLGLLRGPVFAGMRHFHNRADATLVPTEALRAELSDRGLRRVRLLRRGVDTALFHPVRRDPELRTRWGVDEDTPVLIHVGRIAAEKNLGLLLRAYAAVRADCPNARLILVGDGPDAARLRKSHPDVVLCGIQRGESLARHFASADLFVFPSLSETFGNVTLEAMASGLATVAYAYGAAGEHLHHDEHGALVPCGDELAFIAHVRALAQDLPLSRTLGGAARMAASTLHPGRVAEQFEAILRTLATTRRGARRLHWTEGLR